MKEPVEFYDLKSKSKFTTSEWRLEVKEAKSRKRYFVVAKVPAGTHESWRVVNEAFAKKYMEG